MRTRIRGDKMIATIESLTCQRHRTLSKILALLTVVECTNLSVWQTTLSKGSEEEEQHRGQAETHRNRTIHWLGDTWQSEIFPVDFRQEIGAPVYREGSLGTNIRLHTDGWEMSIPEANMIGTVNIILTWSQWLCLAMSCLLYTSPSPRD